MFFRKYKKKKKEQKEVDIQMHNLLQSNLLTQLLSHQTRANTHSTSAFAKVKCTRWDIFCESVAPPPPHGYHIDEEWAYEHCTTQVFTGNLFG